MAKNSKLNWSNSCTTVCVEYVWIGGKGELRSKTRVLSIPWDSIYNNSCVLESYPIWNYDGSSTDQAETKNSEIILKPCAIFKDPFRGGDNKLVLCHAYDTENKAAACNNREKALEIFNQKTDEEPWYGLEQEYFLIDHNTKLPLGFPNTVNRKDVEQGQQYFLIDHNKKTPLNQEDAEQGQYYCSAGYENAFGRHIAEEHLQKCIEAGIKISGINAEVAPGQWEFQIGPCVGIEEGDHLYMARYILQRVAEKHNVIVNLEPKPVSGNWNGSGCHMNFSTKNMREGNDNKKGIEYINEAIEKLSKKHAEHMAVYGENNDLRMTGKHETADYNEFSDGISNRGASIRRGFNTIKDGCGYFEDRRPASNCDPYLITSKIFETCVL